MSALDIVKQINADIAGLPAEYRGLVELEQTWAHNNPGLYAATIFLAGTVFGAMVFWIA